MTIEKLIESLDRHTNNGTIDPQQPLEENVTSIRSFTHRDWLALRNFNLKQKSNLWIECLFDLLDKAHTREARQMIVYIALNGTEENYLAAIKYIQSFRRDISTYTWLKLKNRSAEIFKNK